MSVEQDIQAKERAASQAATGAEREKILNAIIKRNEDLAKRQKEAKRLLESKKGIYDRYITQLSTGKSKGKTLSKFKLDQIRTAAEDLNKELADLRKLIAQKPEVVRLPSTQKPGATKTTAGPTGTVSLQATKTAEETAAAEAKVAAPGDKKTPSKTPAKPENPAKDKVPGEKKPKHY